MKDLQNQYNEINELASNQPSKSGTPNLLILETKYVGPCGWIVLLTFDYVSLGQVDLGLGYVDLRMTHFYSWIWYLTLLCRELGIQTLSTCADEQRELLKLAQTMFDTKLPPGLTMMSPFSEEASIKKIAVQVSGRLSYFHQLICLPRLISHKTSNAISRNVSVSTNHYYDISVLIALAQILQEPLLDIKIFSWSEYLNIAIFIIRLEPQNLWPSFQMEHF